MGILRIVRSKAEDLAAKIETVKTQASEAYGKIENLEAEGRKAESFEASQAVEAQIAELRWEISRADAILPKLEEQLADARWEERKAAFHKHRKAMILATRRAMDLLEAAAAANAAILVARDAAGRELGGLVASLPLTYFAGVLMPSAIGIWRSHTERAIAGMERAEPIRPAKPPAPGPRQPGPYAGGENGPVIVSGNMVFPTERTTAAANHNLVDQPAQAPAAVVPVPAPNPKRQQRQRPGCPREGEVQIHFLGGGSFQLPDGEAVRAPQYANLSPADAEPFLKRGVASLVDPADYPPAPIEGSLAAEIDVAIAVNGGTSK